MNLISELAKIHNGDVEVAKRLITSAAKCGFHSVKLQAYDLDDLIKDHPNYDRYVKCHLNLKDISLLNRHATANGVELWCSVFSTSLISPLADMFERVKIPSTYLSKPSFIEECLYNFKEVHISTGMHCMEDIKNWKDIYGNAYDTDIVFYHCTSLYPTPHNLERLSRIQDLSLKGFSYHGNSIWSVLFAHLLGAQYIELHYNPVAEPWQWNDNDMMELKKQIECMQESLKDSNITEEELKNYKYYKKEYKSLC